MLGVIDLGKVWQNNLIDTDTGELVYKYHNKGIERLNDKGYLFRSNSNKFTAYSGISLPEELSDNDIGKVYRLKEHLEKNTNMLRIRNHRGYFPMVTDDFAKVWNVSHRRSLELIKKLKELGVLSEGKFESAKTKTTQYFMNPIYFHNGRRITPDLYSLFEEEMKDYLPDWVIREFEEGFKNG